MTPEERVLLQHLVKTVEENNKILRGIRSSMRWARIWSIVYWTIIIGSAIGAYYFIEPYLEQILSVYNSTQTNIDTFRGILGS